MPATELPPDLRRWLNRATFGVTPTLLEEVRNTGWERWVAAQLAPDEQADTDCLKRLKNFRLLIEYEVHPMAPAAAGAKAMMNVKDAKKVLSEVLQSVSEWREVGRSLGIRASVLNEYETAFENPLVEEARKFF